MNKNNQLFLSSLLLLLFLSCTSAKNDNKPNTALFMKNGWYLYDFECTYKGIEDEYNQYLTTKTKTVQELIYKYIGVVCYFENGVLYDPVMGIELLINSKGEINCAENISIKGTLEKDGRIFWIGLKEEYKRLTGIIVKGTLRPLSDSDRGGGEYDGVYHMIDLRTKKEQLVNIKNGFYTWKYIDGQEAEFTPWPILLRADGSVSCGMEITTVKGMGNSSRVNYTTVFSLKGKIASGQKISMGEIPLSSGAAREQRDAMRIYSGTVIRPGEYSNEAIPKDIESLVNAGRLAIKAEPKPNLAKYPPWYLKLPAKPGFIYAVGEKTSAVQKTAFALAEAAAANFAEQILLHIEGNKSKSTQQLNYKIIEQYYNEETHTAFVLVEMPIK
jgi:hypothetical protein